MTSKTVRSLKNFALSFRSLIQLQEGDLLGLAEGRRLLVERRLGLLLPDVRNTLTQRARPY